MAVAASHGRMGLFATQSLQFKKNKNDKVIEWRWYRGSRRPSFSGLVFYSFSIF